VAEAEALMSRNSKTEEDIQELAAVSS